MQNLLEKVSIWQLQTNIMYLKLKFTHKDVCFTQSANGVWTEELLKLTTTPSLESLKKENAGII